MFRCPGTPRNNHPCAPAHRLGSEFDVVTPDSDSIHLKAGTCSERSQVIASWNMFRRRAAQHFAMFRCRAGQNFATADETPCYISVPGRSALCTTLLPILIANIKRNSQGFKSLLTEPKAQPYPCPLIDIMLY